MNVGDKVTHVNLVGTIVGVSRNGNPVVEWDDEFAEEIAEELIVVTLPTPNEDLDPSKDAE